MNAPFGTRVVPFALPPLHADQERCDATKGRFLAVRCGRRWGKSHYGIVRGISCALGYGKVGARPGRVGWFAPEFKKLSEAYGEMINLAEGVKSETGGTRKDDRITLMNGGRIDFWSLEDEHAGRSRRYDLVIIDEGAFTKDGQMMETWEKSIKPTLFDTGGQCIVASNTNGVNPENFLWRICNEPRHGFQQFHAPTRNNPILPLRDPQETDAEWLARREAELAKLKADNPPLVYLQEYEAEFVDWSGAAFFSLENLLVNSKPLVLPRYLEAVFAVVDTAVKDGKDHDSTACIIWGVLPWDGTPGAPRLVMLDYHVLQIEGAMLETWLPTVLTEMEQLARTHSARKGSLGAWIEDKASGSVLLQQARIKGYQARPIDAKLTSLGKDGRAILVSGDVYRGMVKFADEAFHKTVTLKDVHANHLRNQIVGYRVGDKNASKRADDLADCFMYGIALALEPKMAK